MKKILHAALLLSLTMLAAAPAAGQATADLEKLVNQTRREAGMRNGTLSVCVYNAATGKQIYSHNAEASVTPASVQKLITTGVGFALLGSEFRFTTKMNARGEIDRDGVLHGNIYITGGGDPLLGS